MSLFDRIKQKGVNKIIDVIIWTDDITDAIIWRFPRYHGKIKHGAQLTVRVKQVAVLMSKGQFADMYQPGRYELTTKNMPILTALKGWKCGFSSPFVADIFFISTKKFLNMPWGTAHPIMMRDPEFGPIRLSAFGSYSFRVVPYPIKLVRKVAETDGNFSSDRVTEQLHNFAMTKFTHYLAESKIAVLDLAANLNEFSSELTIALKDDFSEYGIELIKFSIENISLPESVENALDRQLRRGVLSNSPTHTQIAKSQNGHTAKTQSNAIKTHATVGVNPLKDAPPHMASQRMYHVAVAGAQHGPFPLPKLQQMAQQGFLTPESLVWTTGMAKWAVANSVPSVSKLFGAVPPPL